MSCPCNTKKKQWAAYPSHVLVPCIVVDADGVRHATELRLGELLFSMESHDDSDEVKVTGEVVDDYAGGTLATFEYVTRVPQKQNAGPSDEPGDAERPK